MQRRLVRPPSNTGRALTITIATGLSVIAADQVAQALVNAGESNIASASAASAALSSYYGQPVSVQPAEWASFLSEHQELTEIVLETLARVATPFFIAWLLDLF